ncbi:hypothetical protein ACSFCW_15135 [Yokenella regensburgei]|uniref:hypothetical protein n=1 Tax=Yokenella regensburgei TaxID=158877 RepID=UPI003ED84BE0
MGIFEYLIGFFIWAAAVALFTTPSRDSDIRMVKTFLMYQKYIVSNESKYKLNKVRLVFWLEWAGLLFISA